MAKVANLMANHNGNPTAVASLYDEKISEVPYCETEILLHFDPDEGVVDESGNIWQAYSDWAGTVSTDAVISDSYAKFDYALQTGGYFLQSVNKGVTLGGRDFTIEGWASIPFLNKKASTGVILYMNLGDATEIDNSTSFSLMLSRAYFVNNNTYQSYFGYRNFNDSFARSAITISANIPVHFAFVYRHKLSNGLANKCYIYINGKNVLNGANCTQFAAAQYFGLLRVGYTSNTAGSTISGLRIVDGVALYTEDFTPPAESFGNVNVNLPVKGNLCVRALTPYAANTKILLHFDDPDEPFKDECGNTWAKSGSPAITDDGYFDKALSIQGGESNCLYTKTNFQIGGQDFTIDFWVNFQSGSTQWATVFKFSNGINTFINQYLFLVRKYLNELEIYYSPTTSSSNAVAWHGTSNINDGNWHHLAVTYNYDAQKLYGFVDGVKEIEIDLDFPRTSYAYCVLGRLGNGGRHFYGYIDEVRFVDWQALWTDNFTPPTKPHSFTQTLYAPLVLENSPVDNTVALLHFDDENNPTKDECGNIWHIDGAPYINTSNAKFGNSVHINSICRIISDYIVNFQGQPLTFDWWGYYTTPRAWKGNVPATFALVDNEGDIKTGGKIDRIYLLCNTSSSFYCFSSYKNGSPKMSSSISYPMNAWHHSAVTYSNGVWRLFIDGVLKITYSFTPTFKKYQINLAANYSAFWGDNFIDTPGYCNFRGYFDEFRFVDGVALYTEDFTPPTAPYTLNTYNGKQPPCIGVHRDGNNFFTVR